MKRFLHFVIFSLLVAAPFPALATRPLIDRIIVGDESGEIFPEKCCWLELPRTGGLIAAKRSEACSAIGGPVGRFELVGKQIWLVGLHRCSGDMPLKHVYPEMPDRTPATWLNGRYFVKLSPMCEGDSAIDRKHLTLEIDGGIATITEQKVAESACNDAP